MMVRQCQGGDVRIFPPKYRITFLFLVLIVLIFILCTLEVLEYQMKSTIIVARLSKDPHMCHSFWTYELLFPADAVEERFLSHHVDWPETPLLSSPVYLWGTTDPAHSTFTIPPRRGGGQWQIGDHLEVRIEMSDFYGRAKRSGGDVLFTRLHNPTLGAGVAGQVVDHLNGSYTAVFSLLWEGSAEVQVTLVHPSEAVTVLSALTREQPNRIYFKSIFRTESSSETTICNVCLSPTQEPLCNYTDPHTGDPWFCYKPKNLSCDTRFNHFKGGFKVNLRAKEEKLFQSDVNMKVSIQASGPSSITVVSKARGEPNMKNRRVKSGPAGYYYNGVWQALDGTRVHQFSTSAMTDCLRGKVVHMYGDSTIRQWFEYLNETLPGLQEFNLQSLKQSGPFMAVDYANNILVTYRCHGPPIRFGNVPVSELRYIAHELDDLQGGTDTVVVIGIWAHFSTFPIEIYIWRLQSIRRAVERLLDRAPGTVVVIRTANPKALTLYETLTNSDWYSLQRDKVLRAVFRGLNVHLVDAWEMVLAHHLPNELHPQPPIIQNMINVVLSYICPQNND